MPDSDSEVKGGSPAGDKKKAKKSSSSKKAKRPDHPPTSEMVIDAIKTLKERNGSSLTAIKNFMEANYEADCVKLAPFIKKYIKSAVADGHIIQASGKGASGSFKLPVVTKVGRKFTGAKPKDDVKIKTAKTKTPTKKAEEKPEEEEEKIEDDEVVESPKQKSTKPSKVPVKLTKVPTPKKATAKKTGKKSGRK